MNQLVTQDITIKVLSSLQLLKKIETCTLVLGNGKGVSLFIRLHAVQGSAMVINIAKRYSVCCEQTGRDEEKNFVTGSTTLYLRCRGGE